MFLLRAGLSYTEHIVPFATSKEVFFSAINLYSFEFSFYDFP